MAVSQTELAQKGALIHLQDLKAEIEELYKAYPGLLKAEQNAKRNATMLAKYGTLNPHKVAEGAATKTATAGPKKSHKKGAGKKAQAAAAATTPGSAAPAEAVAPTTDAPAPDVLEMSGEAEAPATVG